MRKALLLLLVASPLAAQTSSIPCDSKTIDPETGDLRQVPITGAPLPAIPEISAGADGVLNGTLYTVSEQVKMTTKGTGSTPVCYPQWVRAYRPDAPKSWNPSASQLFDPMPGPTLRARVGQMVELTFLNSIDANKFPNADKGGCDETNVYPGKTGDTYPGCFAGSVFTNVHYHGTHTSPSTTADNVFLNIKPSPRNPKANNAPIVTAESVKLTFGQFFADCEKQLKDATGPKIWPRKWQDLRPDLQSQLMDLVKKYGLKGWYEANQNLIADGHWPQYYVGAFPYCFKIPEHTGGTTSTTSGDVRTPHTHGAGTAEVDEAAAPSRPLLMGQAPGTHWYHAHKHGSTTVNVLNGMTGAFIIEGSYDDDINAYYGEGWTRKQPVMVIQQLGSGPSLLTGGGGGGGPEFSVNSRLRPVVTMAGSSVQMWRIVNSSSRAGTFFIAPAANTLQWRQLAQDGVQLKPEIYGNDAISLNRPFLLASGNRADLLVKAPPYDANGANTYDVFVYNTIDPSDHPPQKPNVTPLTLLTVKVTADGPPMDFIPVDKAPRFPEFLRDIKDEEITGTKILKFASSPLPGVPPGPPPASVQTIDGKKFDGEVGAVVELNHAEEWKIVNETYPPATNNQISHPFHIHINPFQVTEVFDPNAPLYAMPGRGTVSTSTVQDKLFTVTGDGTSFTADVKIGDAIWIYDPKGQVANAPGVVTSIISDTELTVDANAKGNLTGGTYQIAVPQYTIDRATARPGQCILNPADPQTWKPCTVTVPAQNRIWWDVFSIPSGHTFYSADGKTKVNIPGYFKMRSRFVDYPGYFVLHCHILAHEDRGMMTVVEVAPIQTPYSHH
jgi:FtsP/CotA-like multicopper oxidase with cupredoxin domain